MERAKDLINEYCLDEFQHEANFSDMKNIGVCYTTTGYDEEEIQVNIDLICYSVKFYINNKLKHTDRYDSLDELIDQELKYLSYDDLYSRACDYMEE